MGGKTYTETRKEDTELQREKKQKNILLSLPLNVETRNKYSRAEIQGYRKFPADRWSLRSRK
jgi:hypothetical protein